MKKFLSFLLALFMTTLLVNAETQWGHAKLANNSQLINVQLLSKSDSTIVLSGTPIKETYGSFSKSFSPIELLEFDDSNGAMLYISDGNKFLSKKEYIKKQKNKDDPKKAVKEQQEEKKSIDMNVVNSSSTTNNTRPQTESNDKVKSTSTKSITESKKTSLNLYHDAIGVNVGLRNGFSYKHWKKNFAFGLDVDYRLTSVWGTKSEKFCLAYKGRDISVSPTFLAQKVLGESENVAIAWNAGGGLLLGLSYNPGGDDTDDRKLYGKFGLQVVSGMEVICKKFPLALGFDFRPAISLISTSNDGEFYLGGDFPVAVSMRYYIR